MATQTQEIKALKQEITELKDAMAETVENKAADMQSSTFSKDNIIELATNAGQTAREFLGAKQEQMGEMKVNTETAIKKRPFTSIAIAVAGGALLTAFLNRK